MTDDSELESLQCYPFHLPAPLDSLALRKVSEIRQGLGNHPRRGFGPDRWNFEDGSVLTAFASEGKFWWTIDGLSWNEEARGESS